MQYYLKKINIAITKQNICFVIYVYVYIMCISMTYNNYDDNNNNIYIYITTIVCVLLFYIAQHTMKYRKQIHRKCIKLNRCTRNNTHSHDYVITIGRRNTFYIVCLHRYLSLCSAGLTFPIHFNIFP